MRGGALVLLLTLGSTAWSAEPADPLWALAQQRAAASRPWVAQTVQNVYTTLEGQQTRTATAVATLTGWDGSSPQRQIVSQGDAELAQLARRALPSVFSPADRPDTVLLAATSVTREDGAQTFEGRTVQAFAVRGTTGRKQMGFIGRVLVDAASGDLLAASYQFDPTGAMKAMRYNVHFAAAQAGQPALPDTSNMEVNIRIPLLGETTIQHTARMSPWVARPPSALP
ncbi:hypothetical protein ACS5PN_07675 [Roseateles sp. NT4]|uniref:hypothetical protein n=1 Tax=Roseateles sp. NT4 TaxID=3453715 RepID=UPI003EED48DE